MATELVEAARRPELVDPKCGPELVDVVVCGDRAEVIDRQLSEAALRGAIRDQRIAARPQRERAVRKLARHPRRHLAAVAAHVVIDGIRKVIGVAVAAVKVAG